MTNLTTGIIGIALVAIFLGILAVWLKALPMILIMAGVLALLIYDFWMTSRSSPNGPYKRL
jgi:hypothetical protein